MRREVAGAELRADLDGCMGLDARTECTLTRAYYPLGRHFCLSEVCIKDVGIAEGFGN